MKILIAGADGQLGRSLVAPLLSHDVVRLDHATLDITNVAAVRAAIQEHRPGLVINAAAYNAVDAAETDREGAFAVNARGPRNLAEACAATGAALVHVSSDYVFDGTAAAPYDEDTPPCPRSVYGESKLAGEAAVRSAWARHYVVRTAWVYAAAGKNFPLTMISLAERGAVRVVDDQRGSPTYAPHLAAAIVRLIEAAAPFGTYHLAGSGDATWYELTQALFERLGITAQVTPVTTAEFPRPAPRPAYSVLTTNRTPRIVLPPWREGLDAFVEELRRARPS